MKPVVVERARIQIKVLAQFGPLLSSWNDTRLLDLQCRTHRSCSTIIALFSILSPIVQHYSNVSDLGHVSRVFTVPSRLVQAKDQFQPFPSNFDEHFYDGWKDVDVLRFLYIGSSSFSSIRSPSKVIKGRRRRCKFSKIVGHTRR